MTRGQGPTKASLNSYSSSNISSQREKTIGSKGNTGILPAIHFTDIQVYGLPRLEAVSRVLYLIAPIDLFHQIFFDPNLNLFVFFALYNLLCQKVPQGN